MTTYEQSVLNANQEAENGLVTFLRAQGRTRLQSESVDQAQKAVALGLVQYKAGTVDFTRITQLEQNLVLQQNTLAQARGICAGPDSRPTGPWAAAGKFAARDWMSAKRWPRPTPLNPTPCRQPPPLTRRRALSRPAIPAHFLLRAVPNRRVAERA